ncbi:MAG: TonB-dependent receptor [Sphingobacteriales bacterium]|nr:MAG: TonB-dependent receptor [Sphingobacteriales bacterium]
MSFQTKNFKTKILSASIAAIFLQQSGIALAQEEGDAVEEIVVSGFRAAAKDAIGIKRSAASVVDAISATDIGKLPDATITDSLQRVPGIQITRSGGEGVGINIRGNGNVTSTLNGEQMLSAGSITTVIPDFADISSTMVSGMEVYKSAEAKNVVSGLAGTVNLKTNRPFLIKDGLTAVAKAEGAQGALGKKTNGTFSGFLGYNNEGEFGATLNVTKGTSYLADYWNGSAGGNAGYWSGWRFMASEANAFAAKPTDINGDGDFNDKIYTYQGHQAGNRFIERDRTGINGSVQYKINDSFVLTGDAFYTKLDEHLYQAAFVADQAWTGVTGWVTPDSGSLIEHEDIEHLRNPDPATPGLITQVNSGNFYTTQSGLWQARSITAQSMTTATNREALNTNIELAFDNGGPITGKVRWLHGKAVNDSQNSIVDSKLSNGQTNDEKYHPATGQPEFANPWANPWGYGGLVATMPDGTPVPSALTQIPVHISYAGGKQVWQLPSTGLPIVAADGTVSTVDEMLGSNINRYSAKSSNVTGTDTNADLNIFRLDSNYAFDTALFDTVSSIDFGVRRGERNVNKEGWIGGLLKTNAYGDAFVARWEDTASSAPLTGESYIDPISFNDLNAKGMIKGISDFYGTKGLGTIYFVDPKAMDNPLAWQDSVYGKHLQVADAANLYKINDVTTSVYLQANIEHDVLGMPLSGNIGMRYIKTVYTIDQSVVSDDDTAVFGGRTYLLGPGMAKPAKETITAVNEYDDFLPAVNLSLDLADDQKLRFAYTKSIGTNNTDQLGGGLVVNRVLTCNVKDKNGVAVACATGGNQNGNPALLPYRQNNLDLSYEWYFSDNGLLSVGLFWVQGLTETKSVPVVRTDIKDSDGVVRGYVPGEGFTGGVKIQSQISEEKKGSPSKGLEIGYKQAFDFLPGFLSGFGLDANVTYSPTDGSDIDYYGDATPGYRNSKYQTNLALWYEKDGLQARIAHNYRSKMYMGSTIETSYYFALYQKPTNYIDASLSYEFYENVTAAIQMTNITQEHQEIYNQWESNTDSNFYNERRTSVSLQVKF